MNPDELRRWAEAQTQELIRIGIDAIEAERSVKWVLEHLPPGADPEPSLLPAETLNEPLDEKAIADARIDWFASAAIPNKFKRLLDATQKNR